MIQVKKIISVKVQYALSRFFILSFSTWPKKKMALSQKAEDSYCHIMCFKSLCENMIEYVGLARHGTT